MQVWSRSRESLEQGQGKDQEHLGTDLSKISCSARWGQGKEESSHSLNPQRRPPQQTQDLGRSVPLPDPEKPPLTPTPALGSSRNIQHPFSSAAPLPDSENDWEWLKAIHCTLGWGTVCCPHPTRAGCRNSLCSQQTTTGLSAKEETAEGLNQESGDLMVSPTCFCTCGV